ncbi:MAG: hypothetical protein NC393_07365 [Clostridium sp.]|nr:hypothetical protein [Clostridium sp.]MCM1171930.1 hypothetical protein [Clostridium sp.]MCM1207906.1 hypothetical protein [Ruminococcus sp.]
MGELNYDDILEGDREDCKKIEGKIKGIIADSDKMRAIDILKTLDIRDKVINLVNTHAVNLPEIESRKNFKDDYKTIYEKPNNIVVKTAFGKKWSKTFNYDYDSSFWSTYIFWRIMEGRKTISNKDGLHYCYEISFDNGDKSDYKLFGDTMNSWSTTLNEFFRLFGNRYLNNLVVNEGGRNKGKLCVSENDEARDWNDFLSNIDNYKTKNPLPSYVTEFMEVVYTIGNFILVPSEPNFNTERESFTSGYWDLTLLAIYEYYTHGGLAQALLGEWAFWFDQYGKGQAGWNKFVEKTFMQPFVEELGKHEYGKPYELWDNHFNGKAMPKEEWQFEQFFVNAKVRILERGELIAKELVEKMKEA